MLETPYFLLDLQKLEKNLHGMQDAFKAAWPNFFIGYSFKTNNLPWLVSWMKKQGVWAEVVSTPEYELAKYVGFAENRIIFNGPNKGFEAMGNVLKAGGIVNLDSFQEIEFIRKHAGELGKVKVGLRINFDLEKACPGETIPGKEPGRFGFNIENGDFEKAVRELRNIPGVVISGIHGHHSTRTKSLNIFKNVATKVCECSKFCTQLEYLDMGGCIFGDKPGAPSFDEYAKTIVDVMKSFDIDRSVNLIMEPGAALVASPFSYVCKVLGTKDIKDVRLVFTDGSVKQIAPQMNPVKFMSTFTASTENRIDRQVVSGYSCIENDRFLELNGERELSVGDIIELKNTGAYSMVLSPLFIEYYPNVYVKDGEEIIVARKKWETSEFIQKSNLCK